MKRQICFIEFRINNLNEFTNLKRVFNLFKAAKNNVQPESDEFWIDNFPKCALEKFYFLETDVKPELETAKKSEFVWHFYSLIELLEKNYEIEYISCEKITDDFGRLEYEPFGYPYGGISGLVTFINSFNCKPLKIDDGTSLYKIDFLNNGDFSITDLKDFSEQNSSVKLFDANLLLRKFINRLRN